MISRVAFSLIFGLPLIFYAGSLTLLCVMFTALIGFLNLRGNHFIPFKLHPWMALTALIIASVHAFLGLSILFGL